MKLTRHNGRTGKNGVYNPKHNDRQFDIDNSDHIDLERAKRNVYWDCYNGIRSASVTGREDEIVDSFEEVEQLFYKIHYQDYVEGQNARNWKNHHPERNRTTDDIRTHKKTCPEETIYQIGTKDDYVDPDVLLTIVTEFITELSDRFGEHFHLLNWSLHLDESTPHIHERHVFDCKNAYGEIFPQQEKALETLGFELPNPEKKAGRFNNRKMVFDATCRILLFDICKKHGLELEEEPSYGGKEYLEKQDYIRMKGKCYFSVTSPKTTAGYRIIPMLPEVKQAILNEKKYQEEVGLTCQASIDGYTDFIFLNRNGFAHNPQTINRTIKRITLAYNEEEIERAERERRAPVLLPNFSCHNLRHTFATRYCENETNLKVIQEIMGHKDIATTMEIYAEATKEAKVKSFEDLCGKIKIS